MKTFILLLLLTIVRLRTLESVKSSQCNIKMQSSPNVVGVEDAIYSTKYEMLPPTLLATASSKTNPSPAAVWNHPVG